jgi:hypothetical protein
MTRLVCKNHIAIILERTGMGTRLELALWYWEKCERKSESSERPLRRDSEQDLSLQVFHLRG